MTLPSLNLTVLAQLPLGYRLLISLLAVFRKFAPQVSNRWLAVASIHFSQPGRPGWMRALGRRIQPKKATGDCSDGCGTCGSCGPKPPVSGRAEKTPLEFRPRAK